MASLVCNNIDPKVANQIRDILNGTKRTEKETKAISEKLDEIKKQLEPLNAIIDSLPRDENGEPSSYVHRVHHESQRSTEKSATIFKSGFLNKAGELLLIAIVVMFASGHFGTILEKALK